MEYRPIITRQAVIFTLVKPLYGSFFAIWDKWLGYPHKHIIVNTPFGKATFKNGAEYKKLCGEPMKRFYKNPKVPMLFFGLSFLPLIQEREERKKAQERLESPKVSIDIKFQLRERIKLKNPALAKQLNL